MSNTETDSENQVTSSTGNAEDVPKPIEDADKTVENEAKKTADVTAEPEASEISTNEVSSEIVNMSGEANVDTPEKDKPEPMSTNDENTAAAKADVIESSETPTPEVSKPEDVQEKLQKMLGDPPSEPTSKGTDDGTEKSSPNVTTENLLSVLEDESESPLKKPVEIPKPILPQPTSKSTPSKPGPSQTVSKSTPSISLNKSHHFSEASKSSKRYIYKLKSKSGKVLRYTSSTPIILKKPVIKLTKMVEEEVKTDVSPKGANAPDEVDSDNSTKENMKENEASGDGTVRLVKRGRPPLSQKRASAGSEDRNSSDTGESKDKTTPSFGMQTRKRQMRFLPDGRVVTPGKKRRSEDGKRDTEESSMTESEADYESDDTSQSDNKPNKSTASKKYNPMERQINERKGKFKKVFDFESYFREKNIATTPEARSQAAKSTSTPSKQTETTRGKILPSTTTSAPSSTPTPKKITSVDPAQLLSSLIGVPIAPSQLNIVKFKPKVIQERTNVSSSTPKKVSFEEDKSKKPSATNNQTELLKNTPFKVVSKPTFQKILPKPSPGSSPFLDKTPIVKKVLEHRAVPLSSPITPFPAIALKMTPEPVASDTTKFDTFTDSKIVKTKAGPKKAMKRKSTDSSEPPKTIYELVNKVFDQMPSWNLHVIPDTNSFCISQVARGRMGIPILKKSIELNSEFFAKVYVHQLHCKRYDGVYDTESKILTLIKEIDALAA